MKESIRYKGFKYLLVNGYYRRTASKGCPHRVLHRHVWTEERGPIPDGYHVHHIDQDPTNNSIENLELLPAEFHLREHNELRDLSAFYAGRDKWVKSSECKEFNRELTLKKRADGVLGDPSDACRKAAADWHASEEGIAWHKEHGKKTWETRQQHEKTCVVCGEKYMAYYPNKSKYCGRRCKAKAAMAR